MFTRKKAAEVADQIRAEVTKASSLVITIAIVAAAALALAIVAIAIIVIGARRGR